MKVEEVADTTSTFEAVVVDSVRGGAEDFVVVEDAAAVGEDAVVFMVVVQEVTFRINIIKTILHRCNNIHLEIATAITT